MPGASAVAEVALQAFLVLLTCRGFGEILATGQLLPAARGRFEHVWRTGAGLAGSTLFLLAGVYAGVPIRISGWVVLAMSLVGIGLMWWRHRTDAPLPRRFVCEERWAGVVFLVVLLCQSLPVLNIGPAHYFGMGKPDHLQYTVCSQFLAEESIHSLESPPADKPWFITARRVINDRLGQNIPVAYVAAILHSHALRVFGTLMAFYLACLAASVFSCLRTLNVSMPFAVMGGLLAGLAHWITYSANCAFLSNASILFILPLLGGAVWHYRQAPAALRLLPALLLAYAFCCYTELTPFLYLSFLLWWAGLLWPHYRRTWQPLLITALAILLLCTPYLSRAILFLIQQVNHGAHLTYDWHYGFAVKSGTWSGWKELFFANLQGRRTAFLNPVLLVISLALMTAAFWGCLNGSRLKRRYLLLLILGSGSYLVLLRAMPDFRIYAFFKLSVTYLPVFIIAIVYGLQTLCPVSGRNRLWRTRLMQAGLAVIVLLALGSSALGWRQIVLDNGTRSYDSPTLWAIYEYTARHPEKTYYLTDRNHYRASWLMYFSRHAKVSLAYAAPHGLVDDELPPSNLPPPAAPYITLDGETLPVEAEPLR